MMRRSPTTGRLLFVPAPPETVAEARRLFEAGALANADIARRVGLHDGTVGRMAKRLGWIRGSEAEAETATEARLALVASIRARADAAIAKARKALDQTDGDASAEREARTLASLARTLRELAKVDQEQARVSRTGARRPMTEAEYDDAVADPDALRDALAERLERIYRERHS